MRSNARQHDFVLRGHTTTGKSLDPRKQIAPRGL
jgi:hypothetical protein